VGWTEVGALCGSGCGGGAGSLCSSGVAEELEMWMPACFYPFWFPP